MKAASCCFHGAENEKNNNFIRSRFDPTIQFVLMELGIRCHGLCLKDKECRIRGYLICCSDRAVGGFVSGRRKIERTIECRLDFMRILNGSQLGNKFSKPPPCQSAWCWSVCERNSFQLLVIFHNLYCHRSPRSLTSKQ